MPDNDIRILTEPERYTPATKYQEKKKTYLWLKVKCEGDDKNHEKEFVKQLEVITSTCHCNRDLTEEEVKKIINKNSLFSHKDCPLPDSVKTYRELTAELNKVFKKYHINTCLRKVHFIAQIEAESDHFNTTVEYADGSAYEGRSDLGNTKYNYPHC